LLLDSIRLLERHIGAGFPPELCLDLVLNELVVRAADATRATGAALALARGNQNEMVCRAATGHLAPDLGVPINTRFGLSAACLQTRQPQLCVDTEFDPRIDPVVSRHLGIRSILIVPIFEANIFEANNGARVAGVLETFSTSPAAFSHNDQRVLEGFAEECDRICQAAVELGQRELGMCESGQREVDQSEPGRHELIQHNPTQRTPVAEVPPELVSPGFEPPHFIAAEFPPAGRPTFEAWTLLLAALAIVFMIAVSVLIGSRIGWLRPTASQAQASAPEVCVGTAAPGCPAEQSLATAAASHQANRSSSKKLSGKLPERASGRASKQTSPTPVLANDELIVYEKGKVIFRMRPATAKPNSEKGTAAQPSVPTTKDKDDDDKDDKDSVVEASSTAKIAASQSVWLSPAQAEARLLSRTEPQYPREALAAHSAGDVILEVQVAEDGSVSKIRTLSGNPLLAAAAVEAVRNWRYQPYRKHERSSQFQTDVTLSFTLPN
jgi:TonB family protein